MNYNLIKNKIIILTDQTTQKLKWNHQIALNFVRFQKVSTLTGSLQSDSLVYGN